MIRSLSHVIYSLLPEGAPRHALRRAALTRVPNLSKRMFVNPGDTVVQVGTPSPENMRNTLGWIGPKGRLVIVEPEDGNLERLRADAELNDPRVTILNKGAWSEPGRLDLTVSGDGFDHKIAIAEIDHDNDLVPNNYVSTQSIEVDTIDNIARELDLNHIDFIEISVNGAEFEVMKGMTESLAHISRIYVRAFARYKDTGASIRDDVENMLKERGYSTVITCPSAARDPQWGVREGDVYGYRKS